MVLYIIVLEEKVKDKRGRFVTVATRRTNSVLEKLRVLGHCANRGNYQYSEQDTNKIFNEIERVTKQIKGKFVVNLDKNKSFKL